MRYYIARHVQGYSAVDHFGPEIIALLEGRVFATRRQCERAIKQARREHSVTHSFRGLGPAIIAVQSRGK